MKVCPRCNYLSREEDWCRICGLSDMIETDCPKNSLTYSDLIAQQKKTIDIQADVISKQNETILQQSKLIDEIYERHKRAGLALTQADVPELRPDTDMPLTLPERIEILAQAVREVIKDWINNEYGYVQEGIRQRDEKVTSSMRSYITQAMQSLLGV